MREIREFATEVRAVSAGRDLHIEGYAAIFGKLAQLPGFREQVKPGAFTRAIQEKHDAACLYNHDVSKVLGRVESGTLTLSQDSHGLHYRCFLPDTQTAREIHESVRRGDVHGSSFAFTIPDGGQEWSQQRSADGSYFIQRDISDVNLLDVSPVLFPAYEGTSVDARTAVAPAELRSAVDALNFGRRLWVSKPSWHKRLAALGVTKLDDPNPVSLGDVYDAMDRRKQQLLEIALD